MIWLIFGLVVFLGIHSVSIVAPNWRNAQAVRIGALPWKGIYAVISIAGFVMLVIGYGLARHSPVALYTPPVWTRHVTALLMVPVFPLFLAAYLPGRIKTAAKHPMLVSVKLWAVAHLLANGTLADVILFGGFLAWAVADRISLKRRTPRPVPGAPARVYNDAVAVIGGLAVYAIFVMGLHLRLIGVSPI